MRATLNLIQRASAWLRKPIIACGLAAGLAMATAPAANAEAWSFSYTGAGTTVVGQINAAWNAVLGVWDIVSVEGTRNGDAITGLWQQPPAGNGDNNYLAGPTFGATLPPPQPEPVYGQGLIFYYDQMDLHFTVGLDQYAFGWISGYNSPVATEGPTSNLDWNGTPNVINGTGRCDVNTAGCVPVDFQIQQVPEINASAGLEALALILVFGFMLREMFQRRRGLST